MLLSVARATVTDTDEYVHDVGPLRDRTSNTVPSPERHYSSQVKMHCTGAQGPGARGALQEELCTRRGIVAHAHLSTPYGYTDL